MFRKGREYLTSGGSRVRMTDSEFNASLLTFLVLEGGHGVSHESGASEGEEYQTDDSGVFCCPEDDHYRKYLHTMDVVDPEEDDHE